MADDNSPKLDSGKLMPSAKPPAPAVTPQPVAETPPATVASETTTPCPKVMAMTHEEKMEAAIRKANLAPEVMEELGDIKTLVATMVIIGGGLILLAATGFGAIAEAIGVGLLVIGAYASGSQIGEGINSMMDFYEKTRCDRAQSQADLADAGKSFADGIAKMGVGGLNLLLTLAGGRKGSGSKVNETARLGRHKSLQKFQNQMQKRGWTSAQIDEAIASGVRFTAPNKVNPSNPASRYVHPKTGRSVVVDDVTGEVLHVGGDGFKY